MFGFLDGPVSLAYHLVTWLAQPFGASVAIVAFIAGVRLLLLPLSMAAVRGERARAVLTPEIQRIRERYRDNPRKQQEKIIELQQSSGTSMFVGCLPMLAQIPFFMVMYRLFSTETIAGQPNSLLDDRLFGVPLHQHFFPIGATHLAVYVGLFALLAVVAWFSARWQAKQTAGTEMPGGKLLRLMPYGTLLGAAVIPLAAGVYLLTTTAWTVTERALLRRATPAGSRDPDHVR